MTSNFPLEYKIEKQQSIFPTVRIDSDSYLRLGSQQTDITGYCSLFECPGKTHVAYQWFREGFKHRNVNLDLYSILVLPVW